MDYLFAFTPPRDGTGNFPSRGAIMSKKKIEGHLQKYIKLSQITRDHLQGQRTNHSLIRTIAVYVLPPPANVFSIY